MILFEKNPAQEIIFIAEIGVNHEGDIDKALHLLKLAAESGADAAKFQSYTPERYASASDKERLQRVKKFSLDERAHELLAQAAKVLNIAFISTPVTEDWVPKLDQWCPAFKIASGDITFEPVIRATAALNKPLIISTGCANLDEIDQAVKWVQQEIGNMPLKDRLILMHCVAAYPTPIEQANIRSIPFLADRYGITVGYSNHVKEVEACLAAVALGASIIEVHFTDQKHGRTFRDHELSFEPAELKALIHSARKIFKSLGKYDKTLQPCETPMRHLIRKGVVAARNIAAGTVLSATDLMYARPATEFLAAELKQLIGKKINCSLNHGELVHRSFIQE